MNFRYLTKCPLFRGCSEQEIKQLMSGLPHEQKKYKKGQYVYTTGQAVKDIGIVLSGSVQLEHIDIVGRKAILGISEAGDIFAESYACLPEQPLLIDVVAREDAQILFIDIPALFALQGAGSCSARLVLNLLQLSAKKNVQLSMRIFHSTPKSIRSRISSYFHEQAAIQGANDIRIPLDRQQLADYLGVDRTALSKELGRMRDEGLLTFHKNEFHLNQQE